MNLQSIRAYERFILSSFPTLGIEPDVLYVIFEHVVSMKDYITKTYKDFKPKVWHDKRASDELLPSPNSLYCNIMAEMPAQLENFDFLTWFWNFGELEKLVSSQLTKSPPKILYQIHNGISNFDIATYIMLRLMIRLHDFRSWVSARHDMNRIDSIFRDIFDMKPAEGNDDVISNISQINEIFNSSMDIINYVDNLPRRFSRKFILMLWNESMPECYNLHEY